ncbi:MAG TPA: NAD(P)/FAD-dependent oxidoreductase [Polyangia bacterium]|nr:NAD(P)/FAD-dependent oxidoreductase [Polyangia bacterium]
MANEAPLPALIIGAGPAGLASAACLARRGVEAVVLEAEANLGASWRRHYDRLHLHTVKEESHLPGLPFDAAVGRYPSRDEVVAYLETYAARFAIAPRTGEAARRVRPDGEGGGGFVVEASRQIYRARAVVVATGVNRAPNPERLPGDERFGGALLHASAYRSGEPFAGRRVLVVGAGNTGAELALDLAERGARPTLALRTPVNVVPRDFLGMPTQVTGIRLRRAPLGLADAASRLVSRLAFGDLSRLGFPRPARGALSDLALRRRIPLIDVGTIAAVARGEIAVRPAVARLTETGAVFADGRAEAFDAVVLATGYRPALEGLVDVAGVLDEHGYPRDWRGGGACPDLYFVGYANVSTGLLREIAREAEAVAEAVAGARPPVDGERVTSPPEATPPARPARKKA